MNPPDSRAPGPCLTSNPLARRSSPSERAASRRRPDADEAGELSPALTELGLAFRHVFRALSRLRGRDTHLASEELSHPR